MMTSRGKRTKMVDIAEKPDVVRIAKATGRIHLKKDTIDRIAKGRVKKGDPFSVAEVAAILAAKSTPSLIPLCHPIPITNVKVNFRVEGSDVVVTSEVRSVGKTGVEMEALVATSVALLTVWDMVKPYEKDEKGQYPTTEIGPIKVIEKVKRTIQ